MVTYGHSETTTARHQEHLGQTSPHTTKRVPTMYNCLSCVFANVFLLLHLFLSTLTYKRSDFYSLGLFYVCECFCTLLFIGPYSFGLLWGLAQDSSQYANTAHYMIRPLLCCFIVFSSFSFERVLFILVIWLSFIMRVISYTS